MYTHTHTHSDTHTCMRTCMHAHMHVHVHTRAIWRPQTNRAKSGILMRGAKKIKLYCLLTTEVTQLCSACPAGHHTPVFCSSLTWHKQCLYCWVVWEEHKKNQSYVLLITHIISQSVLLGSLGSQLCFAHHSHDMIWQFALLGSLGRAAKKTWAVFCSSLTWHQEVVLLCSLGRAAKTATPELSFAHHWHDITVCIAGALLGSLGRAARAPKLCSALHSHGISSVCVAGQFGESSKKT